MRGGRAAAVIYEWSGVSRSGTARTGRSRCRRMTTIGAFVAAQYRAGDRKLTVTADGREVGRIDRTAPEGKRVWWES